MRMRFHSMFGWVRITGGALHLSFLALILIVFAVTESSFCAVDERELSRDAKIRYNAGIDHQEKGRYAEAVAEFEVVVKEEPEFALSYFNLGYNYEKLGKLDKALEAYNASKRYDPTSPMTYFNLGLLHRKIGEDNEATADFNKVLELDAKHDYARHNLWEIYVGQKKYDMARTVYQEVLTSKPEDVYAKGMIAVTYWKEGRCKEAVIQMFRMLFGK